MMDIDEAIASDAIQAYEKMEKRSCRMCENFIRVREDGDFKKIWRRGFCIYGQLQGDFSLYVSSRFAAKCEAFLLSDYNYETTQKEHELNRKWAKFSERVYDRRTREYKAVKQFITKIQESLLDYLDLTKAMKFGWVGLKKYQEAMQLAYEYFVQANKEEFEWLWKRRAIPIKEYYRIIGVVTKVLADGVSVLLKEI
jgi:hypothetical protein